MKKYVNGELLDMTSEEIAQKEIDDANYAEQNQAIETARTNKENLKASAKAKLVAGEALTEEEANVMIGG